MPHHHVHTLRALSPTLQSRSRGSMSGGGSGSWCRQEGTAVDFQRVISSQGDRDGGEAMAQRDAGSQPSRVPPDQGEGWRWCWMPWRRLGSLPVPLSPRSKIPSRGLLPIHSWPSRIGHITMRPPSNNSTANISEHQLPANMGKISRSRAFIAHVTRVVLLPVC